MKYSEGCLDRLRISPESFISSSSPFLFTEEEKLRVSLPGSSPDLSWGSQRGEGWALGWGRQEYNNTPGSIKGHLARNRYEQLSPRSGQCNNFGHMLKPDKMIIGNDGNVLNCARGERVGVVTFLRSGMTWTMLLRKILILRILITLPRRHQIINLNWLKAHLVLVDLDKYKL